MRDQGGAERPIRILYLIGTLDVGGTEGQLATLALGLDRRRFVPEVCCLERVGPLATPLREAGIPVTAVPFRGLSPLRQPLAVCRRFHDLVGLVRRCRPDILHAFLPHANVLGALAARLARVPVVLLSLRGLDSTLAAGGRVAARLADAVLTNAEAVREHAVRVQGLPAAKCRVIRNGLDLEAFDRAARAHAPGLPPGRRVAAIANPNRFKTPGLLVLVRAAAAVVRAQPEVRFAWVGDGPCRPEVEEAIRAHGLADRFVPLGSRADVPAILAACELMVLPSFREGMPNAVLEAMAAGRPVVASRVGGVPEAVFHGTTGLLVPPGDPEALAGAILDLLGDRARGEAMGRAGRERVVREFRADRMIRETTALYEERLRALDPSSRAAAR